jgi:hypothetical protein
MIIFASLTLYLSQSSTPIQNSCGLLLLMGLNHACLIPTVLLRLWVGWHFLQVMGREGAHCTCGYYFNMGKSQSLYQLDISTTSMAHVRTRVLQGTTIPSLILVVYYDSR